MKAIRPSFGNAKSGGTHVNFSGAAVAKNAPHLANAVKLIEYLVSEKAQAMYAKGNYETPVRAGVKGDESVNFAGVLKVDPLQVAEIAKYRKQASQLVAVTATARLPRWPVLAPWWWPPPRLGRPSRLPAARLRVVLGPRPPRCPWRQTPR